MKKNFFVKVAFMLVAVLTAFVFVSCSKDDDEPTPPPFEYKDPCLKWHCTIDDVRTYMNTIGGYTEIPSTGKESDGKIVYEFRNDRKTYRYTIDSTGLIESEYSELYAVANFDKLKDSVTRIHGVKEWNEEPVMSGVEWWTTSLTEEKAIVSIGKTKSPVEHMYVIFKYSDLVK